MLQDYPNYTFTSEQPELSINFMTGMKLTLLKFLINYDLNFITAPSLGLEFQIDDKQYPVRSFANFVSALQKDPQVVEINMTFEAQEECIAKNKIVDQKGDYDYSITMVYDIQPLAA